MEPKIFTKGLIKIKKDVSKWGIKDLWGDFDFGGAYKNNLKITEVRLLITKDKKAVRK